MVIFEGHFIDVDAFVFDAWVATKVKHKANTARNSSRTAKMNMVAEKVSTVLTHRYKRGYHTDINVLITMHVTPNRAHAAIKLFVVNNNLSHISNSRN